MGTCREPERRRQEGRALPGEVWATCCGGDGGARPPVRRPQPRLGGTGRYMHASQRTGISYPPSCPLPYCSAGLSALSPLPPRLPSCRPGALPALGELIGAPRAFPQLYRG